MKSTNSLLESEVASMEEELQRKKEERDVEKQMEKKRIKDLERDKQLEKDARVRMLKGYIVKSRYTGPKNNGSPPITVIELWFLQVISLYFLCWH